MNKYIFGTDPELFVYDQDTNTFVSAHDKIPGSKHTPFKTDHGYIQPDGIAAEFNTAPADNAEDFVESINLTIEDLKNEVRKVSPRALLIATPTVQLDTEIWDALPAEVKVLGCMPDYNAWTLKINDKPNNDVLFRSGGFHLHVGWGEEKDVHDPDHFEECALRIRQLECAIYPTSTLYDHDTIRRKLYGAMGAFRPKPYGFEWRTLSNAILRNHGGNRKHSLEWLFNVSKYSMEKFDEGIEFVNDEVVREHMSKIASGNISSNEVEKFVYSYMPDVHGVAAPTFLEV